MKESTLFKIRLITRVVPHGGVADKKGKKKFLEKKEEKAINEQRNHKGGLCLATGEPGRYCQPITNPGDLWLNSWGLKRDTRKGSDEEFGGRKTR